LPRHFVDDRSIRSLTRSLLVSVVFAFRSIVDGIKTRDLVSVTLNSPSSCQRINRVTLADLAFVSLQLILVGLVGHDARTLGINGAAVSLLRLKASLRLLGLWGLSLGRGRLRWWSLH
jgi:hypothetical protein